MESGVMVPGTAGVATIEPASSITANRNRRNQLQRARGFGNRGKAPKP
jgi:hypothetical protein